MLKSHVSQKYHSPLSQKYHLPLLPFPLSVSSWSLHCGCKVIACLKHAITYNDEPLTVDNFWIQVSGVVNNIVGIVSVYLDSGVIDNWWCNDDNNQHDNHAPVSRKWFSNGVAKLPPKAWEYEGEIMIFNNEL